MTPEWAIIGGGLMGLTIALRLAKAGQRVTVIEAAPTIGGLCAAWSLDGITWDKHYHVTLLSDTYNRAILQELGLEDTMRWVTTRTGFQADGQLAPLSSAIDYLRLPGLSPLGKLRLAGTIVYGSRVTDWRALEQIPVETWLRRWSGNKVFDRLWLPLLRAKLGEGYQRTSAAFIWATIRRLYAARRTGLKKEMFGYVPGGYGVILARFAEVLQGLGVSVQTAAPVERVAPEKGRLAVTAGGKQAAYDRVVITTTPALAARVCAGLDPELQTRLADVEYQGIVCAALLLERPLADYYLTYLTGSDLPFTAVVEMSAFVDPVEFRGHGLVYLPRYAHAGEPIFSATDEEIRASFLAGLARVHPHFRADNVRGFRVSRVREVFPIPTLGYSRRLPATTTNIPGLHLVSSAHIVNGTLNVNDTVRVAESAARSLLATHGQRLDLNLEDEA
jgi:protoporphyrinogen oxidase